MKFNEYPYERPDLSAIKVDFLAKVEEIKSASDLDQTKQAIRAIQSMQNLMETQMTLASVRQSLDTKDDFYNQEKAFWDQHSPIIQEWVTEYKKAVLANPFKDQLGDLLPQPFFAMAELDLKLFDAALIPLMQEENRLVSEYENLAASAVYEYKGKTLNLYGMMAEAESVDRQQRQEVNQMLFDFYQEHLAEFDSVYDKLVKVRHELATKLGFKNFIEMGYARMYRMDYNRDDVEVYRREVLKHVVPLAQEIFQRQANRLGLDELKYYDLALEYENGNAIPKDVPEVIVENGVKMYHELSPETAEFIDFMVEGSLLDLVTKPGKKTGGYCTYLPDFKAPFIFSNFNGTSADIDVLTHEAGHAFQVYQSRWVPAPECVWPTYESCEIHSMSMEFFAWPWMELFFKEQTPKYKYSHLSGGVKFLPYGVLVDHFQHEVYEHPEMTPEQRRATWRKLEKQYNPWKDYDGNEFLENGGFWFKQAHIFATPFYYIDYTLAQVCAFQFWKRAHVDQDPQAWQDYLKICQIGGTQTFLSIVKAANLASPFEEGTLGNIIDSIRQYLNNISEADLEI
ncbi:M3 family oligoendopeptidase [Vaginisenegalia massiliensis]|uniref:M3 family oligoendopeptidase n=1 Tax=Vaginisenegalia massiliensis TaxID=2058294 RepID=UPI000F549B2E|nr:M3 family oligoendopeptidase [Vaginisenegalia massiliensis]